MELSGDDDLLRGSEDEMEGGSGEETVLGPSRLLVQLHEVPHRLRRNRHQTQLTDCNTPTHRLNSQTLLTAYNTVTQLTDSTHRLNSQTATRRNLIQSVINYYFLECIDHW